MTSAGLRIGLVADDLTGATDTAVQFAEQGWGAVLSLRPHDGRATDTPLPDGTDAVHAVSTDSRAAGAAAAGLTAAAVQELAASGADRLYLKVDSTMRGSVAEQVRGALQAWDTVHAGAFAVVCPAYPAMRRTVEQGVATADGALLQDGPAGSDPVTPVRTSRLAELLPGSQRVPPARTGAAGATAGPTEILADALQRAGRPGAVLTVDARDDEDLDVLASALARLGPHVVSAGSAGLAGACARVWGRTRAAQAPAATRAHPTSDGPTVVLVTSLHRVARAQEHRLREALGGRVVRWAPASADLQDDAAALAWRAAAPSPQTEVLLVVAPEARAELAGGQVARRLAALVDAAVSRTGAGGVVVTGGDGARALVDVWDATGLVVLGAVGEGIPFGRLLGGQHDGLPVVTKAGGFGDPDALVHAVAHLRSSATRRSAAPIAPHSERTA